MRIVLNCPIPCCRPQEACGWTGGEEGSVWRACGLREKLSVESGTLSEPLCCELEWLYTSVL